MRAAEPSKPRPTAHETILKTRALIEQSRELIRRSKQLRRFKAAKPQAKSAVAGT